MPFLPPVQELGHVVFGDQRMAFAVPACHLPAWFLPKAVFQGLIRSRGWNRDHARVPPAWSCVIFPSVSPLSFSFEGLPVEVPGVLEGIEEAIEGYFHWASFFVWSHAGAGVSGCCAGGGWSAPGMLGTEPSSRQLTHGKHARSR